ncbi:hypothetical protein AX14_004357 [Amanita brunnescens Koide BX004]|nr:hypothetical protein AX14_004357 [Amanita brunnescens Koide BX004]
MGLTDRAEHCGARGPEQRKLFIITHIITITNGHLKVDIPPSQPSRPNTTNPGAPPSFVPLRVCRPTARCRPHVCLCPSHAGRHSSPQDRLHLSLTAALQGHLLLRLQSDFETEEEYV